MRRTRRQRRVMPASSHHRGRWPELDAQIHGDLDDLSQAIDALTSGEFQRLVAFWETVDPEARTEAHQRAQAAAAGTLRRDVIHTLQEELIDWATPSQSARGGRVDGWLQLGPEIDRYDRRAALPALLDTALALTVQDELDDADFETLFGPWRDAMGDGDDDTAEANGPTTIPDPNGPPSVG
jgi:hypothetical protein